MTLLRMDYTIFKEDIKARAEANLSKILQLARGDSSKQENLFADNTEDQFLVRANPVQLPDPITDVVPQFNQITQKTQLNSVNVITSLTSQEGIEIQQGGSSNVISENLSNCIPYCEFAVRIKLHLKEATDVMKKKYNIDLDGELTDLLHDTFKNRRLQLTPPSGGKGISHYLENVANKELSDNDIIGRQREAETSFSSSSSSGISPNFDATIFSPSNYSSPLGVIRHYERNLVKHSCADKKSLHTSNHEAIPGQLENCKVQENGSHKTVAWLRSENKENLKLLTSSAAITSNQVQIPKTVLIDPVQYLQRYEKSPELNNVNKNKRHKLTTVSAANANVNDGNGHQHMPLTLDNHLYNVNDHGNYDSLNKNLNLLDKNTYDHALQSHYVNNNSVTKYYSEPFPVSYDQPPDLPARYVTNDVVSKNNSAPFPATHQIMSLHEHQLPLDYRQFQEPGYQILQGPSIENARCRFMNHHNSKDFQRNNHLSYSQIMRSRDVASPNLFSPAKSLSQSQYDSRSSQHVYTQHPSNHLSNGFNYSHSLLKPLVTRESNIHHLQMPNNIQTLPKDFLCEYDLPQESICADNGATCNGAFVTSQQHVPLQSNFVQSLSAQPILSADLINCNGEHNFNAESHIEVPSSTSRFFTDLIDFCS